MYVCSAKEITYMQRKNLHIETLKRFSPLQDYTVCGACNIKS
jgi:hypothetical protein